MVTEAGDLTNAGEVVEALGRAWTLSHRTPGIRAKFSAWAKAQARRELFDGREEMGPLVFRESLAALNAEIAAGSYNWGSPLSDDDMGSAVQAVLGQVPGRVKLIQLLLERSHGDVPAGTVRQILLERGAEFMEAVRACLDPNRQAPATPKPGPTTGTNGTGAADSPTAIASSASPAPVSAAGPV